MADVYKKIRMKADFDIVRAADSDAQEMCDMFFRHISLHNEYISHGELQMGVGQGKIQNGSLTAFPSPHGPALWMKYILDKIRGGEKSAVFKASVAGAEMAGFCVVEITDDGAEPFGVVCDVLVNEECRCCGLGSALLDKGIAWLHAKGVSDIYLESGVNNKAAHEYFMRRGFVRISEIYKLGQ